MNRAAIIAKAHAVRQRLSPEKRHEFDERLAIVLHHGCESEETALRIAIEQVKRKEKK